MVWQYLLGIELHWTTLAFAVIVLLAVGSDYNLLVVSRFKEEIAAGIKPGIIRAMGATGGVVTAAGHVFAVTMASMVISDLVIIGQIGTTIGLGVAVRHIGGAVADDAVHRGAPGPLVLVATTSAQPTDADRTDIGSTTDRSHRMRANMSVSGWVLLGIMVVVAGVAVAWPAHADPDTDFANE